MAKECNINPGENIEQLKQWCDYAHLPYEAMTMYWDILENEILWIPTATNPHYTLGFNDTGNFVAQNLNRDCSYPLPAVSVVSKDKVLNILHIILNEYCER